jgi:hypothetical protein
MILGLVVHAAGNIIAQNRRSRVISAGSERAGLAASVKAGRYLLRFSFLQIVEGDKCSGEALLMAHLSVNNLLSCPGDFRSSNILFTFTTASKSTIKPKGTPSTFNCLPISQCGSAMTFTL